MSLNVKVDTDGKCTLLVDEGLEFSEQSVKAALAAHAKFDKPYIFKAGDVAKNNKGLIRVICSTSLQGYLISTNRRGELCLLQGQKEFEQYGYVKIGELRDYLPKDK